MLTELKDLLYVEDGNLSATTEIEHQIGITIDKPLYSGTPKFMRMK